MEELPLSGLVPGDPRNRLSAQARRRVVRAGAECNRIQWEALATARARHLSDEKTRYLANQADLKGARTILKVLAVEYVDADLNLKEFWAAMRDEIESVSNSFSLYDTQRRLLEAEFLTPPEQKGRTPPHPSPTAVPLPVKAEESIGQQIKRLSGECHFAPDELAVKIGINVRTVRRHLADRSVPHDKNLWAYETFFSKLLNKKVVIRKMS